MDETNCPHTAVAGLCWGDEGKGKIVDLLSPHCDLVVRYNGGANAGHTVCVGEQTFALHLLPSGVLHPSVLGVIGPGVVVDPLTLLQEIDALAERGLNVIDRLRISDRAHVVTEYHQIEDRLTEGDALGKSKVESRKSKNQDLPSRIGTTVRGIGPCYADKARRSPAIRMGDLLDKTRLADKLHAVIHAKRDAFQATFSHDPNFCPESITEPLLAAADRLRDCICDTTALLHNAIGQGQRLLFEGANGMLLDIDHGTFPYVTSSSTGPWGIWPGAGVPAKYLRHIVGVTKAYATRVGAGPFPSELSDAIGDRIRETGHEYGTTTGRPRRCGWFDAAAVRRSVMLGGITEVALMHLDTLAGLDQVGICTAYRAPDGRTLDALPAGIHLAQTLEPVVEMLPGWTGDLRKCTGVDDLPAPAMAYVQRIQDLIGAPITLISVGPDRAQTLMWHRFPTGEARWSAFAP
ncbi:MAG: adenylosuccinate synthase [Phycisphaerae bacterium]